MRTLTRKEELVLLAVFNLKEEAYLIAIFDYLTDVLGESVSLTSVHLPLSRLEKHGLISAKMGGATAVRGGRRKKYYRITPLGWEILEEHKRISDRLWAKAAGVFSPKE
jgi:PadR family transcriptional regulator PadR